MNDDNRQKGVNNETRKFDEMNIKLLFVSSLSSSSLSSSSAVATSTSTGSTFQRSPAFAATTTVLHLFLGLCMIYPTARAFLVNKPQPILPFLRGTYSYRCRRSITIQRSPLFIVANNDNMSRRISVSSSSVASAASNCDDVNGKHTNTVNNANEPSNNNNRNLVIVLAGVTGVGKSDVAAYLCRQNKGIIVSADSVQAYRGVQIGANKPSTEERIETPHILIDVADHTENYNAADWRDDAVYTIQALLNEECDQDDEQDEQQQQEIDGSTNKPKVTGSQEQQQQHNRRRQRRQFIQESINQARITKGYKQDEQLLPVVCGGTMMYIQWLVHGRPDALKPSNTALQKAEDFISNHQESNDWVGAVEYVTSMGDIFATRVTKLCGEDWYRLRRILEVAYTALEMEGSDGGSDSQDGKNATSIVEKLYTGQREGGLDSLGYDVRCFFLCPDDRMQHTTIIDRRCEQMVLQGLLKETSTLSVAGCLPEMAARAIGYRQVLDYFARDKSDGADEVADQDRCDQDEAVAFGSFLDDFTTATRRYAKKQMSWFRKDGEFLFVPVSLTMDKEERVKTTATAIQELCQLSREDYEKVRTDNDSISAKAKQANESQGKSMKFYQFQRHILKPHTKELKSAISEAIECHNQMNAKRKREHSEH